MSFPREHRRCIKTNSPLERLNREVRGRTRVVGAFPDGQSALMLVAARLLHVAGTKWGTRRYLDMKRLRRQLLTELGLTPQDRVVARFAGGIRRLREAEARPRRLGGIARVVPVRAPPTRHWCARSVFAQKLRTVEIRSNFHRSEVRTAP
jgi:hypothetical protein